MSLQWRWPPFWYTYKGDGSQFWYTFNIANLGAIMTFRFYNVFFSGLQIIILTFLGLHRGDGNGTFWLSESRRSLLILPSVKNVGWNPTEKAANGTTKSGFLQCDMRPFAMRKVWLIESGRSLLIPPSVSADLQIRGNGGRKRWNPKVVNRKTTNQRWLPECVVTMSQ